MPFFKRKTDKSKQSPSSPKHSGNSPSVSQRDGAAKRSSPAKGSRQGSPQHLPNGEIGMQDAAAGMATISPAASSVAGHPAGGRARPRVLVLKPSSYGEGQPTADVEGDESLLTAETPLQTSSRLSKTLLEILHDKDALPHFIPYMHSRGAGHLIRFWLDAESFQASSWSRMQTHALRRQRPSPSSCAAVSSSSASPVRDNEGISAAAEEGHSGKPVADPTESHGPDAISLSFVEPSRRADDEHSTAVVPVPVPPAVPVPDPAPPDPDPTVQYIAHVDETNASPGVYGGTQPKQCPHARQNMGTNAGPASPVCAGDVPGGSRPPLYSRGCHAAEVGGSSSASSKDAVPSSQSPAVNNLRYSPGSSPAVSSRCANVKPSRNLCTDILCGDVIASVSGGGGGGGGDVIEKRVEVSPAIISQPGTCVVDRVEGEDDIGSSSSVPEEQKSAAGSPALQCAQSPVSGSSSSVGDRQVAGDPSQVSDTSSPSKTAPLADTQSEDTFQEKLRKSIEKDAVSIYSRYISLDATSPIRITEDLRNEAISKICREDGQVDPRCFEACQAFTANVMDQEYFQTFLQSDYHCKHQIAILTGSQVYLADVLYNELALSYFMEFMEREEGMHLLQCWLDLENFQQHLASQHGSYDGMEAQSDAMVIYEKYFSLQATQPVGFEDSYRFEAECNICREGGPLPDCFAKAKRMVLRTIDKIYFGQFVISDVYYKYLGDMINSVQTSHDMPPYRRKRTGSDASSEKSLGSQSTGSDALGTKNTLLATDTSGFHIKKALNKVADDMRIDTALFNPDMLWQRPQAGLSPCRQMSVGKIDSMGQFVSQFDPEPDHERKASVTGGLFKKNKEKEKAQEDMAMQIAQMIISDITMVTQSSSMPGEQEEADS